MEVVRRAVAPQDIQTDGRTVVMRLLTYAEDYTVSDDGMMTYVERWRPGAFKRSLTHGKGEGIPFTWEHPEGRREMPLGGSQRTWEEIDGTLMVEGRVSRTVRGDELVELLRDRVVRGASIDATVFRSMPMVGGFERCEAALRAVAFTTLPQYADAGLVAMRSEPEPEPSTPRLDALRERTKTLWHPSMGRV